VEDVFVPRSRNALNGPLPQVTRKQPREQVGEPRRRANGLMFRASRFVPAVPGQLPAIASLLLRFFESQ